GFCTATCPTYVLLGDELDSPRGRIYLIKDMLENDRPAAAEEVKHLDRCLSCLSCMTTCPSGVHYMHLVDRARVHVERTYRRPGLDRLLRAYLAWLVPVPWRFRLALWGARLARPLAGLARGRLGAMLALAPATVPGPSPVDRPQVFPAQGPRRARMALMTGCAQQVLAPEINEATVRLLTRHGVEVVVAAGAGCCGALTHHMGKEPAALASARANVAAWSREIEGAGLDAIVINTSGCGTTVKDYGHMLRTDPAWCEAAAKVSALTRDVAEVMSDLGLADPTRATALNVAYQSPCSMQHGQKITRAPQALLAAAGFAVREVHEGHLCCGSAGTYNQLQPDLAARLRDRARRLRARKVMNIESLAPDVIASGNVGCMKQIAGATRLPVVHAVELLDWATGGPRPKALGALAGRTAPAATHAAQ
ncbi:MAG: glycolate oxidase subunit GlcF, partial [Kiloniellaceae bacterium]